MEKYPPYSITDRMLNYVSDIMKKIGEANYFESLSRYPELRRKTRIRSIHSSLAIENNQLSLFQVEDVINGKMVIGEQKDIQEVKNAYKAYDEIDNINPYSIDDLKKIHGIMTFLTVEDSGKFRNHGEAVYDGDVVIFMCPPENMVNQLMEQLFNWMKESKETVHPLILSCIFHYEFVFIHPFTDGNGRMARLWQTAILANWEKLFKYMPIESLIKKNQEEYYKAISDCNKSGNSNEFIEFMLKMINETIDEMVNSKELKEKTLVALSENEQKILECIKKNVIIGAKEIIEKTNISDRTVRRILKKLIDNGTIEIIGNTLNSPNKKYKMAE